MCGMCVVKPCHKIGHPKNHGQSQLYPDKLVAYRINSIHINLPCLLIILWMEEITSW